MRYRIFCIERLMQTYAYIGRYADQQAELAYRDGLSRSLRELHAYAHRRGFRV